MQSFQPRRLARTMRNPIAFSVDLLPRDRMADMLRLRWSGSEPVHQHRVYIVSRPSRESRRRQFVYSLTAYSVTSTFSTKQLWNARFSTSSLSAMAKALEMNDVDGVADDVARMTAPEALPALDVMFFDERLR